MVGVFVPIVIVAVLIPVSQTSAQLGSIIDDLAYSLVSKVMWAIAWFLAMIGGIVVAVVAWFVEVALNMSTQVVNSTPVQSGFPITLAVTNMGFVAAVIVIAFATILRYKDYVVKKTLPKLIAAALLVNFSLVFAGAIINFADQFTLYFIKQINPASEGSITNFASAMAGAFNPQKNFLQGTDPSAGGDKAIEGVASSLGSEIGKYLVPVTSTSFTLFAIIAIILTLIAFVALLLIRYVYLVVLLIVMPFVWLMWIFPGTKKYFSDWWNKFLKQVFFAPVSVFFLYLAILFATKMSVEGSPTGTATASNTFNSLNQFGTEFLTTPVQNLMNSLVIVGLMLGGMFAASKIGAAGASAAQKAVIAGTGAIGIGLNAKAGGAAARFLTQGPKSLPSRPTAPERSLMGRVLHPIETIKHGVAVAGWQAKKAVKPITDPIREKVGGKFEESMTPQTKFQDLAKMNSLQLRSMGYDRDYVDQMAAKEREANLKIEQRKVRKVVADYGKSQRGIKIGSLVYGTAWGIVKETFKKGIEDMGGGHGAVSIKQLEKMGIHVAHDDDHGSDNSKTDSHGGGDKH